MPLTKVGGFSDRSLTASKSTALSSSSIARRQDIQPNDNLLVRTLRNLGLSKILARTSRSINLMTFKLSSFALGLLEGNTGRHEWRYERHLINSWRAFANPHIFTRDHSNLFQSLTLRNCSFGLARRNVAQHEVSKNYPPRSQMCWTKLRLS